MERIVSAALAEQLSGWARVEQIAGHGSRERFLAALDKVPASALTASGPDTFLREFYACTKIGSLTK